MFFSRKPRNRTRRFFGDRRGATAVEFAIIAPLFFAATLGTFEAGRMLFERNQVAAAAAAGARAVAVYGSADTDNVKAAINSKLGRLKASDVNVAITDQAFGTTSFRKIVITYNFSFLIKFFNMNGLTITATRYAAAPY